MIMDKEVKQDHISSANHDFLELAKAKSTMCVKIIVCYVLILNEVN